MGGRIVACVAGMRNAHKILVGESEEKRRLGGSRHRKEKDDKIDLG
jgi:hypothetical protein